MKVELDSDILLKIDYAMREALKFLRGNLDQGLETNRYNHFLNLSLVKDDLSDAVCRIQEQVNKVKES
jgi:hypothetical protein